jgi:hypothetical protein
VREALTEAVEELKRVDHLIYVSLKYTRTVDVIRSVINRLIDCYLAIIEGLVVKLEEENKIYENPNAPMLKVKLVKEHYNDPILNEYMDFFIFLRQLYNAEYKSSGEFRKNVTMTSSLNGKDLEIKIDTVTEYYMKTKEFLHFIKRLSEEKNE